MDLTIIFCNNKQMSTNAQTICKLDFKCRKTRAQTYIICSIFDFSHDGTQ